MISDEQLIMSIIDQKSILNFSFIDIEFLSKDKETHLFFFSGDSIYLADFLNGIEIHDVRSFFAGLRKKIVGKIHFEPFVFPDESKNLSVDCRQSLSLPNLFDRCTTNGIHCEHLLKKIDHRRIEIIRNWKDAR